MYFHIIITDGRMLDQCTQSCENWNDAVENALNFVKTKESKEGEKWVLSSIRRISREEYYHAEF